MKSKLVRFGLVIMFMASFHVKSSDDVAQIVFVVIGGAIFIGADWRA